jgi:putative aldouronate transport system permease protein
VIQATLSNKKGIHWNKSLGRRIFQTRELYLFLIPAIVVIFMFNYLPMYGIQIAFKDFKAAAGIEGSSWVGLKHFVRLFTLPSLMSMINNTLSLSILGLALGFPIPIVLALMLNQVKNERYKKLLQTTTYLPHFISTVVVVGMILVFLSPRAGIYGLIASFFNMKPENIAGKTDAFRWLYVLTDLWQHTGWNSILYLAALAGIDPTLYEAAVIDGANKWRRIIHIDIPSLIPTMIILLILSSGGILNVGFEKVYLMQNSSNIAVSEVINTYVYKIGLLSAQFSFSAAVSLINTFINFIMLFTVNAIARRVGDVSLW